MRKGDALSTGALLAGYLLGGLLVVYLALPWLALGVSVSIEDFETARRDPLFGAALFLSLRTTFLSLIIIVVAGTPLAWWMATSSSRLVRLLEILVDLPVVTPPAVVGIALLLCFGRQGLFGPSLESLGIVVPFTEAAVVLAQVVVAAPFYLQGGANAFRKVDVEMLRVARTLGATRVVAFARVAIPIALPGLLVGAALAWARSLGEFGATLLFAGSLPGTTQTVPLAIFMALESDVRVAVVLALVLAATGVVLLVLLRALPFVGSGRGRGLDAVGGER